MSNGIFTLPDPYNEPIRDYAPGSPERASLKARLEELDSTEIEIPLIIGGKEVRTGNTGTVVKPHDHEHVLATYHKAGADEVAAAIDAAKQAHREWSRTPWEERAAVLLRAADLLSGPWRDTLNAATMLGQSKTAYQAEIDAACELADFWRFNPGYMRQHPGGAAGRRREGSGTGSSTGRWRGSCSRWRRSTSRPSPATCPRRLR